MKRFGDMVKQARIARGWRGSDLAEKIERADSFVSRIENGTNSNPPDLYVFDRFEELLGLDRRKMLVALGYLRDQDDDSGLSDTEQRLVSAFRSIPNLDDRDVAVILAQLDWLRKAKAGEL